MLTILENRLAKEVTNLETENRSLRSRIDYLLRQKYGRKSEKLDVDQLTMELAGLDSKSEAEEREPVEISEAKPRLRKPGHGRNRLPEEMEERIVYIDPPEVLANPEDYREIGQEKAEQLDIVPPKLVKVATIRRSYVSREGVDAPILIAPVPARAIDKGLPTARLLAWVAVSKYCDHMPLYRQAKAFRRLGCEVSRKTMSDWMRSVEFWLSGICDLMLARLLQGNYVQADETPIKYIDEDFRRGKCSTGYLWGVSAPGLDVVFHWAVTRKHAVATSLLAGYEGLLQSDGYEAYEKLEGVTRIACMAHIRRKFEAARKEDLQFAAFVLFCIRNLYAIERRLRESKASSKLREAARASESAMIFERLGKAIELRRNRYLPKSEMGKAVGYALGQWEAMSRYLEYGEAHIDNNLMENAIRPTAIGKKNWLFIGNPKAGRRSAVIYSIVGSCERRGIDPFEYMTDVLERLPAMQNSEQYKLTPENWAKNRSVNSNP